MTASISVHNTFVYINGVLRHDSRVQKITQSVGYSVPDVAIFDAVPGHSTTTARVQDIRMQDLVQNATVQIVINNEFGRLRELHFGRVVGVEPMMSGDQAVFRYTSRLDEHMFGDLYVTRSDVTWTQRRAFYNTQIDDHSVMNPEVEGLVQPNMALLGRGGVPVFVDPKSLPFTNEKPDLVTYRATGHATPVGLYPARWYWSLFDAVRYLCYRLNAKQKYVKNPIPSELYRAMRGDGTDRRNAHLRNHRIKIGEHLPSLLDDLLGPYGFAWHVHYDKPGIRRIRVFRRGRSGVHRFTYLQPQGSSPDLRRSTVKNMNMNIEIASQATNAVVVLGDFEQMEGTFILEPGWQEIYDYGGGHGAGYVRKHDEATLSNPWRERVWNTWVLNEGGDYTVPKWRAIGPYFPARHEKDGAFPLYKYFGHRRYIPRRRKFLPTITAKIDGTPLSNVFVEYATPEIGSNPYTWAWEPIETHPEVAGVRPLSTECGIKVLSRGGAAPTSFAGKQPGGNFHVRATATIQTDVRMRGYWVTRTSKLADLKPAVIERKDFKYRWVQLNLTAGSRPGNWRFDGPSQLGLRVSVPKNFNPQTGLSELIPGLRGAKIAIQKDFVRIQQFAKRLAEAWNTATINGSLTLEGFQADYCGFQIQRIIGRNLNLNVAPIGFVPSYPDVMRVDYLFSEGTSETLVTLASYQDPIAASKLETGPPAPGTTPTSTPHFRVPASTTFGGAYV